MSRPVLPGYRLRRLLHRGTSFEVHEAWSIERACPVVVKLARLNAQDEAVGRLVREGQLLLSLSHPHLVRAYEVHAEPRAALVLETLPGRTLGHLLADGPLAARDVVMLGRQLVSVVSYLHGHDVIHADLKPGNAAVGGGLLRVMDLSLAQRPGPWRRPAGTPGYLAPEQAVQAQVSPATDVWGIGLLLLEAASGEDPFPVGCPEYDEDHGPVLAPRPLRARRRVPPALGDLVAAMTRLEPDARVPLAEAGLALDRMPGRTELPGAPRPPLLLRLRPTAPVASRCSRPNGSRRYKAERRDGWGAPGSDVHMRAR